MKIGQILTQLTKHLECSAGESLPLQNNWRRWTQNTSYGWVGAVWPINRWCRYQPRQWRRRPSACVRVCGAHFEHKFWEFL